MVNRIGVHEPYDIRPPERRVGEELRRELAGSPNNDGPAIPQSLGQPRVNLAHHPCRDLNIVFEPPPERVVLSSAAGSACVSLAKQ